LFITFIKSEIKNAFHRIVNLHSLDEWGGNQSSVVTFLLLLLLLYQIVQASTHFPPLLLALCFRGNASWLTLTEIAETFFQLLGDIVADFS
jgi:hypothetical protein